MASIVIGNFVNKTTEEAFVLISAPMDTRKIHFRLKMYFTTKKRKRKGILRILVVAINYIYVCQDGYT